MATYTTQCYDCGETINDRVWYDNGQGLDDLCKTARELKRIK